MHMHVCDEYKQEQLFPSKSVQVSRTTESLCYDVKWGYEWRYLTPGDTAVPMGVGRAATITTKLVGLIATKLWALSGAISGICWFSLSSGRSLRSHVGKNPKENLPYSQSAQPVCPQIICLVKPWGPENLKAPPAPLPKLKPKPLRLVKAWAAPRLQLVPLTESPADGLTSI